MKTDFTKRFFKQLEKLNRAKQDLFWERLALWKVDPTHTLLNDHALRGKFMGARSINIGGDLRAVYRLFHDGKLALFDLIGTHHQLYGK